MSTTSTAPPPTAPDCVPSETPQPIPPYGCGDGQLAEDEQCDDGNQFDDDGCTTLCREDADWRCPDPGTPCFYAVYCGDGILSGDEECDDANIDDADGCSAECKREEFWECPLPGAECLVDCDVRGTSECEDNPELCELPCAEGPRCGDGIVQDGEACDNEVNLDHYFTADTDCAPGCVLPRYCGDGLVSSGYAEQCDNGAANSNTDYNGCTLACELGPRCGDSMVTDFEACDDGNRVNGDGCDVGCSIEANFTVPG
jgi:cysteine-rich repeat protein